MILRLALPVVAIIGRPNVGKSTLVNRLCKSREAIVHDEPGVTRDRTYQEGFWRDRHFRVVDTGGLVFDDDSEFLPEIREQANLALAEASVAVVIADGQQGLTAADEAIAEWLRFQAVPVLLAQATAPTLVAPLVIALPALTVLFIASGVAAAVLAGLFPVSILGELVSMGTLLAFTTVCLGVLILRIASLLLTATGLALLYWTVPNRPVKKRDAFIGGLAAGICLEAAKQGFGFYVTHFTSYELVYGAFAAVPVFLLWIYASWLIVVSGALPAAVRTIFAAC